MGLDPPIEEGLEHPRVYRVSMGLRLTCIVCAIFLLVVGVDQAASKPHEYIASMLFMLLAIYAVSWAISARMTLSTTGIKINRPWPFESREMPRREIAGRHWASGKKLNCYVVVANDGTRIIMDGTYATDHFLDSWVRSLPNLDPQDHEQSWAD